MNTILRFVTLTALAAVFAMSATAQDAELPQGVTAQEIRFYSEGVQCYGRIFYPKDFNPEGKYPGVVLSNGWGGLAGTPERYAARLAAAGIIAMAIDYRGWGKSGGFVTLAEPYVTSDWLRFTPTTAKVRIKRTRLLATKQIEDIRNAISYLQGEPGVDRDRIGLWGTSYSGGHVITCAALDARVKVGVCQVPAIAGKNTPQQAVKLQGAMLQDAIQRARTGQGGEFETGFTQRRMVDLETQQAAFEYRPFHYVEEVPETVPILFIVAEKDELINNRDNAYAASEALKGETKVIEIPGITHFEVYRNEPFEQSSKAAVEWFTKHL